MPNEISPTIYVKTTNGYTSNIFTTGGDSR